jgi:dihydroorotate dehydrogenase electron transfer subunit
LSELKYDQIFACGPSPMLRAIQKQSNKPVELSLEAYMACGLGVCLGCVVKNKKGDYVRVCKDGPVFSGEELW